MNANARLIAKRKGNVPELAKKTAKKQLVLRKPTAKKTRNAAKTLKKANAQKQKKSAVKTKNNQTVAYVKLPEPLGVSGNFHFPLNRSGKAYFCSKQHFCGDCHPGKSKKFLPQIF